MKQTKFQINLPRVLFIVLLFCIILLIIYSLILYRSIEQSRTAGFADAESFVLQNSDIIEIDNISYFQAEEGYFTLIGNDINGGNYYIFLRDDTNFSKEHLYVVSNDDLISPKQLEEEIFTECKNCTLVRSEPAMIDELPLWELTYIDNTNRYVIEYKYLDNGKTFEKLRLTRKYKKD